MNDPEVPAPPVTAVRTSSSRLPILALIAVVLAAGLAALSWIDSRQRIGSTQEELARRLHAIETDSREARTISRQAQEALREAHAKIATLEARLAESQSQQ